jgi:hypothetical protein
MSGRVIETRTVCVTLSGELSSADASHKTCVSPEVNPHRIPFSALWQNWREDCEDHEHAQPVDAKAENIVGK